MVNMAVVQPSVVLVICTLLWILPTSYGAGDPCTDYESINDPYRSAMYKLKGGETAICDHMLVPGWYRFTSKVGGKMPTTKPEPNQCGTVAPIWMKGTHPRTKGEVASALACTNINNRPGDCEIPKPMSVKNCGEFFVYNLQPSGGCAMAYCAGDLLPCPKGQTGIVPNCRNPQVKPGDYEHEGTPSGELFISISHDEEQRSIRRKRFVSNDSVCVECTNSSGCQQKNGTCAINGHCYAANESNPKDWCLQCLPSENTSSWSPRKVNQPPKFAANQSTRFAIHGELLPLQFKATDPDNRPVKYSLTSSSATGYTFTSTGLLTWNVTTHTNQNESFTLRVTDECNATDTILVSLVIQPCYCLNGGKCLPVSTQPRGSGHYRCACPKGFTGAKCKENIDDCPTAQCVNGTCVDGVDNYTCRCDAGFTGILCDQYQSLPRCTNQTCFPGVTCTEVPSGVSCGPCPAGFSGDGKTCAALPTTSAPSTNVPTTVPTTTLPPPTTTAPTTTSSPPTTTAATTSAAPTTTEPPTTTQPTTLASISDTPTTTDQGTTTTQLPTSQARFNETSTKQAEKPTTETTGAEPTTNTTDRVVIQCEIKILRQWDDKYSDVQSEEFRELSNILWKEIWASFVQKDDNFMGAVVSKLRKGSIIAEFELTFKSEPEEPLKLIKERIKDGKLGQLEVDPDSLRLREDVEFKKEPEPKDKDSVVLIIVLVVLAIVFVIVIVVVILYKRNQKRTRNLERIRKKDEDGEPGELLPLTEKNSSK